MTSPLLDENIMLAALDKPVDDHEEMRGSIKRLSAGATMLLVAAYDRKVTRAFFMQCVAAALGLVDVLGHYDMISGTKAFLGNNGKVSEADIEVTLQHLLGDAQERTERCAELGAALTECALDEDTVQ